MLKPTPQIRIRRWWRQRSPRARLLIRALPVLLLIVLCLGVGGFYLTSRLLPSGEPEPTATLTPSPSPYGEVEPSATPIPTPQPSPTPPPPPTATTVPSPTPTPAADAQGDVGLYETGEGIANAPAGTDIHAASVDADLHISLQPSAGDIPEPLQGWVTEDQVLLWILLYDPVPAPPSAYTEWLFALDLDGDVNTGRPADTVRINPDLGMEAALGVYYDPGSDTFGTYFLVWDPAQGGLVRRSPPRFAMDESRTLIGLALPLESLVQAVEETSGITVRLDAVRGRAAALSNAGGQRVVDFFPDRPE